jgi:endonuclease YncB( thermonuclease family)
MAKALQVEPRARLPQRRPTWWWGAWLLLAVIAAGSLVPDRSRESALGGGPFELCSRARQDSCVIDGDTIRHGGLTIRLEDIDAPETHGPRCADEAALGERARRRLLELINAGPFEVIDDGGRDVDLHGRKLRVIQRDGRRLSETLIAEGLARPWDGARHSWCG